MTTPPRTYAVSAAEHPTIDNWVTDSAYAAGWGLGPREEQGPAAVPRRVGSAERLRPVAPVVGERLEADAAVLYDVQDISRAARQVLPPELLQRLLDGLQRLDTGATP